MKRFITVLAIAAFGLGCYMPSHAQMTERDSIAVALKQIDPNIVKYFPRWRVCEPNLQLQIHQTFLLFGKNKEKLDMQSIVVTAAPKSDPEESYTILLVECGDESFAASEVDAYMRKLGSIVSEPKRPYCFREIPAESPLSEKQYVQITDFNQPTHVSHSISLSAFEQSLKIGLSGFWLRNVVGNDQIGYPFWTAGQSRIMLQRPLYENDDPHTRKPIPYLMNIRLGASYRMRTTGLERGVLSFIPERKLNSSNGTAIMSLDLHAPMHPQAGISINYEPPLSGAPDSSIVEKQTWAKNSPGLAQQLQMRSAGLDERQVIPVLRSTGQISLFYNLWLDPAKPENYFRFDLGMNYVEVQEWAFRKLSNGDTVLVAHGNANINDGLNTYKPASVEDWLYARIEYRNQSTFPFGVATQYANNNLLLRAFVPLVGDWLYLEGKYSTPLRNTPRPWESRSFFLVSPILRLNIR